MRKTIVHPNVNKVLDEFELAEGEIGFGKVLAPIMAECDFKNGHWQTLEIKPYSPLSIDPTCKVLHYGQEIFEGMKRLSCGSCWPLLFRLLKI